MHIGLLEDNPSILELMQTALELSGHTISTHTHGQSLLNALLKRYNAVPPLPTSLSYDLLIIDLNLPDELSGLDVISSIYRLLAPDVPPIIVVSAASIDQLDQLRNRFPMLPIVRKPFAIKTLVQTISSMQSKGTHELEAPHSLSNRMNRDSSAR